MDFDLGDLPEGVLGVAAVDFAGGVEDGEAGGVDLDAATGDTFELDAVFGELFAEWSFGGVIDAGEEPFEGFFGLETLILACNVARLTVHAVVRTYCSDGSHRVVDSAWAKTALDHLETTSFAEAHVACRYADVFKLDVAVAVGRIVKANDGKHACDGDTWCICRHEDNRLLLVDVRVVGIRLAHDDIDLAA